MRWVIPDAKGAPDDLRHPLAGPHLAAEAVRFRPAVHEGGQLGELLGAQARLPTGCGMAPQPFHALLAPPLEPLADGTGRHAESGGDVLLFPALLFQLPGTLSPPLAPIELRHLGLHGANISSFYASTQRSVERACERARQTGLWVVGHGHRRIDGAEVFAVPSMRHPETQWWLVAVVDGRLACDCPAGRQGRMCQHRGAVHAFLAAGLLAARSARQTASSPRLRTDTRPFSIWK